MRSIIYVDVLLLTNGVIAVLLLGGTALLCRAECRPLRLVWAGFLAAASSLILLAPDLPFWLDCTYQMAAAFCIVRAAFVWQGIRVILRQAAWYFVLNLLLAGAVSGLCVNGAAWAETNHLVCYFAISPPVLFICCSGIYVLLRVLLCCFGATEVPLQRVLIRGLDWQLWVQAYCDTGFLLVEPFSRQPTVMLYYTEIRQMLPAYLLSFLEHYFSGTSQGPDGMFPVRFLLCDTVTGKQLLPAVPARIVLPGENERPVYLVFTNQQKQDKRYTALIGPALGQAIYGRNRRNANKDIAKTSKIG